MSKKQSRATPPPKKDASPYVFQKEKYDIPFDIKEIPWNPKQLDIINRSMDKITKMVMVDGIWGSGKTILAVYACLKLLKEKKISNIIYLRNAVQSGSGTLGWLPGDLDTRIGPYVAPLYQKLEELLPKGVIDNLLKHKVIECHPTALIRGLNWNACGVILDEAGCMTREDLLLSLSRVGKFSKVFVIGDSHQTDVSRSGFLDIFRIFNDDESKANGIFTYELQDEADVVRSEFLRFVMRKVRENEPVKEEWTPRR